MKKNMLVYLLVSIGFISRTNAQERSPTDIGIQSGRYQVPQALPKKKVEVKVPSPIADSAKVNVSEQPIIVLKKDNAKKEANKKTKSSKTSVPNSDLEPVDVNLAKKNTEVISPNMTLDKSPEIKISENTKDILKDEAQKKDLTKSVENSVVKADTTSGANPVVDSSSASEQSVGQSLGNQIKTVFSGETTTFVQNYIEQVHPDDNRLNQLELTAGAGVFYNDNKSNYSFRNFQSSSPTYHFGAQVWITPLMGFSLKQISSVGADVAVAPSSRSSVQYDWSEIKFDFRKFYGLSRKSNSVVYSVYYFENKFSPPSDSKDRVKSKSSGLGFAALIRIPESPHFSWLYGVKFSPRVSHSESSTGIDLSSGDKGESSLFGLSVGGEIKMNRENRFQWDTSLNLERNQFKGTATLEDPETGSSPNGVSVTNTTLQFNFGYTWGQ